MSWSSHEIRKAKLQLPELKKLIVLKSLELDPLLRPRPLIVSDNELNRDEGKEIGTEFEDHIIDMKCNHQSMKNSFEFKSNKRRITNKVDDLYADL